MKKAKPSPVGLSKLELVTIHEVAEMLGFTHRTIRKWVKARCFPQPMRFGRSLRWKRTVIEAWVAEQERASARARA